MTNNPIQAPTDTTRTVYDRMTIGLHWATATLVTVLWLMGRTIGFIPRGPLRIDMWSLHILFGAALACVLVARIIWRSTKGRKLPPANHDARELLALVIHKLLYLLLAAVVVLGVINVFTHAFPLFNTWRFPKVGSGDLRAKINNWHDLAANVVMAVALLHALAALFHHHVMKDTVLRRMWPAKVR
jgi:cytochrome b561